MMRDLIRTVFATVAFVTDYTVAAIRGPVRYARLVDARHVAAWLLRQLGLSYPDIGANLGGKHHTTSMEAVRRVDSALRSESGWIPDVVVDVIGRMAVAA